MSPFDGSVGDGDGWGDRDGKGRDRKNEAKYYIGVDGEGVGRDPHRYTLLAWSSQDGLQSDWIEDQAGLSSRACFDFLLKIPRRAKPFAYAFNYDMTKMFTDVDNESLYKLFRPGLRKRQGDNQKYGPIPVKWTAPATKDLPERLFFLNLQGTKLTIEDPILKKRRVIWDVFKFFQAKFTSALVDWKVATEEALEEMRQMKSKRSSFKELSAKEIREYCLDECRKMADLAGRLVDAHEDAGLELKTFYGAGSTGGAMLKKMGIDKEKRVALPEMHEAIACGFFGGRFENSVIGDIDGPLWSYDISSAYPYETTFLPCLQCGTWSLTQKREDIENARMALVRYSLGPASGHLSKCWGPFPFRIGHGKEKGSICYPSESGGGWVWDKEYREGERLFPNVRFEEAWMYEAKCRHQPFRTVPGYYLLRLKIGKEGKGIVIKLGINSVYGKLAQSLGDNPPFQCWIWAGMITSGTRAQILRALALHADPANLLMVATDGICSRERLHLPIPRETHTGDLLPDKHGKLVSKPLGGWEEKEVKKGVFFVRPGIYFPMNPTKEEIQTVRARGVGRAVMFDAWESLVEAWKRGDRSITLANVDKFCGAKSSITIARNDAGDIVYNRSKVFGEWVKRPIELTFDPLPKRERVLSDRTLEVRKFPLDLRSVPYEASLRSQEALILKNLTEELLEQPDGGDYMEYEDET